MQKSQIKLNLKKKMAAPHIVPLKKGKLPKFLINNNLNKSWVINIHFICTEKIAVQGKKRSIESDDETKGSSPPRVSICPNTWIIC